MKRYNNPKPEIWKELCKRPALDYQEIRGKIESIFEAVLKEGDEALRAYTLRFDNAVVADVRYELTESDKSGAKLERSLKDAIDQAYTTIRVFHRAQMVNEKPIETTDGVTCWRENRAIEKVGLYIPGGTAPLVSTVLMLGVPAQLAGCEKVVLCTPPDRNGEVNRAICYAAALCGVGEVFRVGGAQAIAAMTYGTKTVPQVSKIFGPGNQYVTMAKQIAVERGVAIDMPAGPSEVMVLADEFASPVFVAADLLSQAEHGVDSQVVLLTNSMKIRRLVELELVRQTKRLPRRKIIERCLENSLSICFSSPEKLFQFANAYAPEHMIIQMENADDFVINIRNVGSVFVGPWTPESAGDYASGTNHTLPTSGWAKSYGGVSLESFQRKMTVQRITREGLRLLAPTVERLAQAEGLDAHAAAVSVRLR